MYCKKEICKVDKCKEGIWKGQFKEMTLHLQISVGEGIVSGTLYLLLSAASIAILLRVIFVNRIFLDNLMRNHLGLCTAPFNFFVLVGHFKEEPKITLFSETRSCWRFVLHKGGRHFHRCRPYCHHSLPGFP